MKSILKLALVVGALSAVSIAAPVCAHNDDVLSGGFACDLGGLTFQNFSAVITGTNAGLWSGTVNLINPSVNGNTIDFSFNPNLPTNADLQLQFEIVGNVNSASLAFNGIGGAFIVERLCSTQMTNGVCTGTTLGTLGVNAGDTQDGPIFFTSGSTWVFKDINSGTQSGISEVSQGYTSDIPEPVTSSLVGIGLLGLGIVARRRAKK